MADAPTPDPDALLDEVLAHWEAPAVPEDFATRIAERDAPTMLTPLSVTTTPTRGGARWFFVAIVAAAAATTLIWLWPTETVPPTPDPDVASRVSSTEVADVAPPKTLAEIDEEAADEWCDLTSQIASANEHYPFAEDGSDLPWKTFDELYGPTGAIARFEERYIIDGYRFAIGDAQLDAGTIMALGRATKLRSLMYQRPASEPDGPGLPISIALRGGPTAERCTLAVNGETVVECEQSRTVVWSPVRTKSVSIEVPGNRKSSSIERTGPWSLLRVSKALEEVKSPQFQSGPVVLSPVGWGDVELTLAPVRWNGKPQNAIELLTTPVRVPTRLFPDDAECLLPR